MDENLTPTPTSNPRYRNRLLILISVLTILMIGTFIYLFLYHKSDIFPKNKQFQDANVSTTTGQSIINTPQGDKVGYIKRVYKSNNKNYIDFDEIEFFLGEEATEAQRVDGKCVPAEGSDCYNPTGYYIRNTNKIIESIQIYSDAEIILLSDCYSLTESGISITIDQFINNFGSNIACSKPDAASFYAPDNSPYWIKLNTDGMAEKMTEQYIP